MEKPSVIIIDALGADRIEARLGVTSHMIRYARSTGSFPASWYDTIERMCAEEGVRCPRSAFNWKATRGAA